MGDMSFQEAAREAGRVKNWFRAIEKIEGVLNAAVAVEGQVARLNQAISAQEKTLADLKTATAASAHEQRAVLDRMARELAAAESKAAARRAELAAEIDGLVEAREAAAAATETARAEHAQVLQTLANEKSAAEAEMAKIEAALGKLKNRIAAV
jgi:predicted  nucleic acid-binding Zn-ribbon protein